MDWTKVIECLNEQALFYADKANKSSWMAGTYDEMKRWQTSADFASILASALRRGIDAPPPS